MAGLTKIVFVGNLPYSHSDDLQKQLEQVFATVGPVSNFRIAFEKETGKPRGFGFCEYFDTQTADSAIRNLQGIEIGGRALRLDFADVGNHDTRDAGGRPPPEFWSDHNWLPPDLPRGQPLAAGQSATDQISQTLAAIPPAQLAEITVSDLVESSSLCSPSTATRRKCTRSSQTIVECEPTIDICIIPSNVDDGCCRRLNTHTHACSSCDAEAATTTTADPTGSDAISSNASRIWCKCLRTTTYETGWDDSTTFILYTSSAAPNYGIMPQQAAPQPVQPAPVIPQQQQQQQPQVVQQPQQNATTAAAQQQAQLIQQVLSLTPQQIDALAPEHRATILQIRQQALSNMTGR
ncbi:hypothetical protein PSHT_00253 [Puccinia striiformis]|uniref:RRM domain-containing protein n=1 Tax=Puccinia striiformis TaxID=27350 RepID=A0A2S4WNQ2_9BASI|nr:hypothetical protein PSHT_00253 [Puccinia striiformis]